VLDDDYATFLAKRSELIAERLTAKLNAVFET
jgi:hypothetical protein